MAFVNIIKKMILGIWVYDYLPIVKLYIKKTYLPPIDDDELPKASIEKAEPAEKVVKKMEEASGLGRV